MFPTHCTTESSSGSRRWSISRALLWIRCGVIHGTADLCPVKCGRAWSKHSRWRRDLLLQAGGFSCIVLDMGSLPAEYALRVPLATWFRFRAAAERLQANVLLLTQHSCSRNSAGLVLRLNPGSLLDRESTIFTGLEHKAELTRQRFPQDKVLPLRKQPQSVQTAEWQARTVWAGCR